MKDYKEFGCVYLIRCTETNRVKIGVSKNVQNRFRSIKTSSPTIIELIYWTPPIKNYVTLERLSHKEYSDNRHVGEWFNINYTDAVNYLKNEIHKYERFNVYDKLVEGDNPTKIAKDLKVSRTSVVRNISYFNFKPDKDLDARIYKEEERQALLSLSGIELLPRKDKKESLNKQKVKTKPIYTHKPKKEDLSTESLQAMIEKTRGKFNKNPRLESQAIRNA